jgi:8-oxo-dGTP diphosphatase
LQAKDLTLVVAAVIYRKDEILVVRRGPEMSGAGHWEFPGGKVEVGESEIQALQREIAEELHLVIQVEESLGENTHHYPTKSVRLRFYLVPMPPGQEMTLTEHDAFLWTQPKNLKMDSLSAADRPLVKTLRNHPRFRIP